MREFQDQAGKAWRVVKVDPENAGGRSELLPPDMRGGWLVFDTLGERRRLSPIPVDWETVPDQRLTSFCESAVRAAHLKLD